MSSNGIAKKYVQKRTALEILYVRELPRKNIGQGQKYGDLSPSVTGEML